MQENKELTKEELERIEEIEKANTILVTSASSYVWNLMDLTKETNKEYSLDNWTEYLKSKSDSESAKERFTNFSQESLDLNDVVLRQGYGVFGRKFIEKVFEEDKDSALNLFEVAIQQYFDLDYAVNEFNRMMAEAEMQKANISNAVDSVEPDNN